MKKIIFPPPDKWEEICRRPASHITDSESKVKDILADVKSGKDNSVRRYSLLFDKADIREFRVTAEEFNAAGDLVSQNLRDAIATAKSNIEKFHSAQLKSEPEIETFPGVVCHRKNVPVEKAGLYIPGGSAPLFSTLLMLGIPAKIAGCREIVVCTPPQTDGSVSPVILYTAGLLGLTKIFKVGGVQAIAAMAYGTETIPKVYKIFGPGNSYVTLAKEMVQREGVAIDMPAGPSEVLVVADGSANPEYVAADLLSQAEHGPDSQCVMVTYDRSLLEKTETAIRNQLELLPRKKIASLALENSMLVLLDAAEECIRFSNIYAPEHLIINTKDAARIAEMVTNAGSVFIGPYSCESMGDYSSGTNHTLPTNGYARSYSGLSVESFMKKITFQEISREGLKKLGPVTEIMAEAESLQAHRNAVSIRLKDIQND